MRLKEDTSLKPPSKCGAARGMLVQDQTWFTLDRQDIYDSKAILML